MSQSFMLLSLSLLQYYVLTSVGDMLGGHVDDMEADWTKPIVSIRYNVSTAFLHHDLPCILT
jgi:hypothetical protein